MKNIEGLVSYSIHRTPSDNSALRASSCKSCPERRKDTVGAYLTHSQYMSEFNKKCKKSSILQNK